MTRTLTFYITHWSAGEYRQENGQRRGGMTLHLVDIKSGECYYAIFNVETRRINGSLLPKNKFRLTPRMAFYKFWKKCGLSVPSRKVRGKIYPDHSAFPGYMGKLINMEVTGSLHSSIDSKVIASTLEPLIRNSCANCTQSIGKPCAKTICKSSTLNQAQQCIQQDQTTYDNNHDKRQGLISEKLKQDQFSKHKTNQKEPHHNWDINNILRPK